MKISLLAVLSIIILGMFTSGCGENNVKDEALQSPRKPRLTETHVVTIEPTPVSPSVESQSTPDHTPVPSKIFMGIPENLQKLLGRSIVVCEDCELTQNIDSAEMVLSVLPARDAHRVAYRWVFALVAPFPTIIDEILITELSDQWRGTAHGEAVPEILLVSEATHWVFTQLWGPADLARVMVIDQKEMLDQAWQNRNAWAIIPFEDLTPRWKVMRIDGISPFDQTFDDEKYSLSVDIGWISQMAASVETTQIPLVEPVITNREAQKFTSLILTGTTALVRNTALRMEEMGVDYPAGDIGDWLAESDFTHISNEVSFYEACPPAIPLRGGQRFCSNPRYMELLQKIGANVIELTGNHLLDWGIEPFLYTLDLYRQNDMPYYGGGINLEEATQPLIIEHNQNRIVLLGCNRAGPENIWARPDLAGTAPCDLEWMASEITRLRRMGYLPVVTFQHYEVEDFMPMNLTKQEFRRMAEAGAVIVSGSQAHFPHGFEFVEDSFMHFGLGNLFFDQMFQYHRRQFIDRHIFYDGKYLGAEIFTAMLEDNARPRPMTVEERQEMLGDYFRVSGW